MDIKANGDYLLYNLDWKKNEMCLTETGRGLYDSLDRSPFPLSPMIHALYLLKMDTGSHTKGEICHFLIDARCDDKTALFTLHRTDNFDSVVNVARSLVSKLLGNILTPREVEIAIELFEGRTFRYIAEHFRIAEGTTSNRFRYTKNPVARPSSNA